MNVRNGKNHTTESTIAAAATEGSTQLAVLVGKIEDGLGQIGRLHDTANFDCSLFLDELADRVEEFRGELVPVSSVCLRIRTGTGTYL